jgi:hypothetical protein
MSAFSTGALALEAKDNHQGGHLFFSSLGTGKILNRNHWTALPMPLEVLDRVHALARHGFVSQTLTFAKQP